MGDNFLLQGIFPTQGSNLHLLRLCIGRHILHRGATWEAQTRAEVTPTCISSAHVQVSPPHVCPYPLPTTWIISWRVWQSHRCLWRWGRGKPMLCLFFFSRISSSDTPACFRPLYFECLRLFSGDEETAHYSCGGKWVGADVRGTDLKVSKGDTCWLLAHLVYHLPS